jgi:hypothetical protein
MGEANKKAKAEPRGMPASTKPINMGTAEQEQKGVNMPSTAERGIAKALCLESILLVFSKGN